MSTPKDKQKNIFRKRKLGISPLAKTLPQMMRILGKEAGQRSSASITRILTHWEDIIGHTDCIMTAPEKIFTRNRKNRQTGEQERITILQIGASSAIVTKLAMRQAIILERLNRLFGENKFQELTFTHKTIKKNNPSEKNISSNPLQSTHYDLDLPHDIDPVLKSRLETLGQAVMNNALNK